MPASVDVRRRARRRATASTTHAAPSRSLCACTARSRPAAGMPGVGEQRARAAGVLGRDDVGVAQRLDRARREVTEVADRAWRRARARPRSRCRRLARGCGGHRAQLQAVTRAQRASGRTSPPRPRPRTRRARTTGEMRHGDERRVCSTTPSVSQNATSIGNRMPDGVHVAARAEHQRAVELVAAEQPFRRRASPSSAISAAPAPHRRARARSSPRTPPSHVEADLEHVAVDDLVVLALDAQLALLLRLRPRADLEQLAARRSPRPRMKPRCRSEWITPAHSGALAPARNVHARDLLSPVVRNVRRPSRWYAARATRGTTPSPRPRPSSSSARSSASSCGRFGLELQAHAEQRRRRRRAPRTAQRSSTRVELVLADVDDDEHRLGGEQEGGREELALVVGEVGAVERHAVGEHGRRPFERGDLGRRATCRPWRRAAGGRAAPRPTRGRRARARARACRGRPGGRCRR